MASSILAPAQTPANSSPIVVTENSSKLITIYTDNGTELPYGVTLVLERLTVAGNYEDVSTAQYGRIVLTKDNKSILINGVGTYRVARPDITAFGVNVGVQEG